MDQPKTLPPSLNILIMFIVTFFSEICKKQTTEIKMKEVLVEKLMFFFF